MEVEKRTNADKKRHEDNKVILAALKNITERVTCLEAEVSALRKENEQLKQNTKQETIQIGNITLPLDDAEFLSKLCSYDYKTLEKLFKSAEMLKASFLMNVALARKMNDKNYEDYAKTNYIFRTRSNGTTNAKILISEIENKSWNEIVQMLRQMMNGATMQNENQGPQR